MHKEIIVIASFTFLLGGVFGIIYGHNSAVPTAATMNSSISSDIVMSEETMAHTHVPREVEGVAPAVLLNASPDQKGGYNLHLEMTDFVFAPEHASGDYVEGEGHAHLYIDGVKITRLYSDWYYLGALTPGTHEVTVTLNGNDHTELTKDGMPISSTVMLEGN